MATAWMAVRGKSATADESSHAAIGWLMLWKHDFRISPDVPPLWEYWAGLGMGPNGMHIDESAPLYRTIQLRRPMSLWTDGQMYHTPGNNSVVLVAQARQMALILAAVLAGLIGWWAWKLGGAVAAVIATYLYCLDPNFLGQGALAKNDVASALLYAAAAYAMWKAGRELTWRNLLAMALLTAAAVAVKFSGVLLGPVLIIGLGVRAMTGGSWVVLGWKLQRRGQKLLAAGGVWALTVVVTYVGLWACYDFRFNAGPHGLQLDRVVMTNRLEMVQLREKLQREPTAAEEAAWRPPLLTRFVLWGERRHLLPQAWAIGFIHTQIEDQGRRQGYVLGQNYTGGKWYYFPLAAVVKSPLATIAALLIAIGVGVWCWWRGMLKGEQARWTVVAMSVPVYVYALATITAKINIGLRHAFPVYPFVFIFMGLALAQVWKARTGRVVVSVLGMMLAAEMAWAYPNYIAFFNVVAEPHRLWLLSDSNFDWGQDLPLLAEWQRKHSDVTLYYDCFGRCDPAVYGLKYVNMSQGYPFGPPQEEKVKGPGVVALSATNIQLIMYDDPTEWGKLGLTAESEPEEVLGTTIYLFRTNGVGK
jgi:hypothetical protein